MGMKERCFNWFALTPGNTDFLAEVNFLIERIIMNLNTLKETLGHYARDIKLNLGTVLTTEGAPDLTFNQIYGIALACAYATQNSELCAALEKDETNPLSEEEMNAAKIAATMMAMNNVYYRFLHLVTDPDYRSMHAKLKMTSIGNPGIEKVHFELYCLAVSAINGCGMCIDSHVKAAVEGGVTKTGVHSTIRIASVIQAVSQALSIKKELSAAPLQLE